MYFLFIYLKNIIRYEVMKDNFHKILRKTEPTFLGNILSELWPKKRASMALHDMTRLNYIYKYILVTARDYYYFNIFILLAIFF